MIRDFRPSDQAGAMALIREVLGDAVGDIFDRRWAWFFEVNPFSPQAGPPFLVTEHDGIVTGVMMSFAAPAYSPEGPVTMYCLADLLVHPGRRGIGLKMGKLMTGKPFLMMGSPNARSLPMWQYLGSDDWGSTVTHSRILDPGPLLRRRKLPGAKLLRAGWEAGFRILGLLAPRGRGVAVETLQAFPPECDALWAEVVRQGMNPGVPGRGLTFAIVRDQAYLNWRFVRCPIQQYRILAARRQGKLTGYAVLRTGDRGGLRRGYLIDVLVPPDDPGSAAALIRAAEAWFREQDVQVIQCLTGCKPSPWSRVLLRSGFWFRKRDHHIVAVNNIAGYPPGSAQEAIFRHISYADGELDFVS